MPGGVRARVLVLRFRCRKPASARVFCFFAIQILELLRIVFSQLPIIRSGAELLQERVRVRGFKVSL